MITYIISAIFNKLFVFECMFLKIFIYYFKVF